MALIELRKRIETLLVLCGLWEIFPVFRSTVDAIETERDWSPLAPDVLYARMDGAGSASASWN